MTRLTASYKSFHNTLLTVIWTKLHNFWLCPLCVTYKEQILSYSLYHLVQVGCYLLSFGPLWNLFLHLGGCLLRPLHLLLFLAFFAHGCCEALTGSVRVKEALSVISKTKSVSHGNPNKPACLSSVKRDSLPATSWKLTRCNNVTAPSSAAEDKETFRCQYVQTLNLNCVYHRVQLRAACCSRSKPWRMWLPTWLNMI